MVVHDEQYAVDITAAEQAAQRMRRGNSLGRVLWLLVEGVATALGQIADIVTKVTVLHDAPVVDLTATNAALQVVIDNIVIIEDRVNLLQLALVVQSDMLRQILAFTQIGEAGPATTGAIFLGGKMSQSTGENTMASEIRDDAGPKGLSVAWSDAKGAPAEGVTDAWSGDNDAVGTVADNGDGSATFTPVAPGTVNVQVVGTNADQTTVTLTDVVVVKSGDAVAGVITLAP